MSLKKLSGSSDPVSNSTGMIPIKPDLKKMVMSAHSAYKECLKQEKEEKKREKARRRKEMSDQAQKGREK